MNPSSSDDRVMIVCVPAHVKVARDAVELLRGERCVSLREANDDER